MLLTLIIVLMVNGNVAVFLSFFSNNLSRHQNLYAATYTWEASIITSWHLDDHSEITIRPKVQCFQIQNG